MKTILVAFSVLLLAGTAAQAEFNAPPPGAGGGPGMGHGPMQGGGGPRPQPAPAPAPSAPAPQFGNGGDRGDHGDRGGRDDHGPRFGDHGGGDHGWDHDGGRGWNHGPRGPGYGYPPPPPPPPVYGFTQYVQCESDGYGVNYCPVQGFIMEAHVVSQESYVPCELGQTYGYQGTNMWVRNGCRATFAVTMRR